MRTNSARGVLWWVGCFLAVVALGSALLTTAASAAERRTKPKSAFGEFNPSDSSVDLFQGMESGQLEVKFIPKDSTQASVLIKNKSDKPLNVKLPAAFAARPVLAQFGGLGGGGGRLGGNMGGGMGGMGGGQMMGGGMGGGMMGGMGGGMGGGMMGGMGGGGMGGGMFNIPPEKVGKLKVACVCLEHGKAEPRAAIPYEIKPIDSLVPNAVVQELCRLVGSGKVNQRAAQAAAWNLQNGLSWDVLANKRQEQFGGMSQPYFSESELSAAMTLATQATASAEQRVKDSGKSPGETAAHEPGLNADALASQVSDDPVEKATPRRKARAR